MIKHLKNYDIMYYGQLLDETFNEKCQLMLPIKANFYIQSNYHILRSLCEEIENSRLLIGKKYGIMDKDDPTAYKIPPETLQQAQDDLDTLMNIEQDVNLYALHLEDLGDCQLTSQQMQSIIVMIDCPME